MKGDGFSLCEELSLAHSLLKMSSLTTRQVLHTFLTSTTLSNTAGLAGYELTYVQFFNREMTKVRDSLKEMISSLEDSNQPALPAATAC